ncbi:phosphate ABC transporter substrate-binding protein [Thermococcus sp. EP1]|uniref:DUF2139 domain-containing protein n=1 Tax=Thermococcus sp. EP1 TaxID=1591054 RepID=UPI0006DB6DA9|nr:DUF2139 domain-containing protein [Thermococcus sp. EP1]KPU62566.1 phosphate ABC transporter substrate-binding protein [Thermococcus sp. EP1]
MKILKHINRFPQRYGPEWGSGGIFGLRYHNDVLYFTVAFEAQAHFIREDSKRIYEFELVGEKPTSGGDTYNAVETVDEFIYFGGWVHAPAIYEGKNEKSTISFVNKYSHVHEYDTENDEIRLLWKESIHHNTDWAGEVSDIIYDPYEDKLLIAREDGHANLGIYELDRKSGKMELLNENPSLKGALVHDTVFFGVGKNFNWGMMEVHVFDLITRKWERFPVGQTSVDGNSFVRPNLGDMESAYNRVFAFVRGGMFVGNPVNEEEMVFVRLFDFPNFYAPMRTNALTIGGGILVAYNAHHDAVYRPMNEEGKIMAEFTNSINAPSLLLYITPPMVKIVGIFGARITSIEKAFGKILLGTNTTPNTGALEATPFDTGNKDIVILDEAIIQRAPPALSISIEMASLAKAEQLFGASAFGGIPLDGYKNPRMIINASKDNRLTVYEYDLSLPVGRAYEEVIGIEEGRNVIDLSAFSGIVSFKLKKPDFAGKIKIELL